MTWRDAVKLLVSLGVLVLYPVLILSVMLAAFLAAGCSSSGSEPDAETPPAVISAPLPPPAPPPAPVAVAPEMPGRAYLFTRYPTRQYTKSGGICLQRWPYYPGPPPANISSDFEGLCFEVQHGDTLFRFWPRSRSGTRWIEWTTTAWRGEIREWQVRDPYGLTGKYEVVQQWADTVVGIWSDWDSNAREWTMHASNIQPVLPPAFLPMTFRMHQVDVDETMPGVYQARRDGGPVDLAADVLVTGLDASLTIDADGTVWMQAADGCTLTGRTDDALSGVWRILLNSSCGGDYKSIGGTVDGALYLAGHAGFDKLVIVGTRP